MLLRELFERQDLPSVEVLGLSNDSRQVVAGDCFFAYKGQSSDGNCFVQEAIEKGAVAICTDSKSDLNGAVPKIYVRNLAQEQSEIAGRFFDHPSRSIRCVGVTGTNGKTSIAYGLSTLLHDSGFGGSVGWGRPPRLNKTSLTTVDAISFQAGLSNFVNCGLKHAILEVSSHALHQSRVDGVRFEVGIFSNLTRDHLDYHGDMREYGRCKSLLFSRPELKLGIVNIDDPFGEEIQHILKQNDTPLLTYGRSPSANVSWRELRWESDRVFGEWCTPWGSFDFELPVLSEFSVANCAAIFACMHHFGEDARDTTYRMRDLQTPPGRMERLNHPSGARAILDFAHTPDALQNVLSAVKPTVSGKLICVFGCGGDRDQGKRSLMGKIAEKFADFSVITSDNPRFEEPNKIIDDIVEGFSHRKRYRVESDRAAAIAFAMNMATKDDLIVIAGKGSEQFMEIEGQRIPFNDRDSFMENT